MNWNDAAEDLLAQILQRTPRPLRESAGAQIREAAEAHATEDGLNRVGVRSVIAGYIAVTPEALRPELPQQFEAMGLDAGDYGDLLVE